MDRTVLSRGYSTVTNDQLAAAVKALREQCGLSQPEFATRLGLTPKSISRYENGGRPHIAVMMKLAEFSSQNGRKDLAKLFSDAFKQDGIDPYLRLEEQTAAMFRTAATKILRAAGISTDEELAALLNISPQEAFRLKAGRSPDRDVIERMVQVAADAGDLDLMLTLLSYASGIPFDPTRLYNKLKSEPKLTPENTAATERAIGEPIYLHSDIDGPLRAIAEKRQEPVENIIETALSNYFYRMEHRGDGDVVASVVKNMRADLGIGAADFAAKAGLSVPTLKDVERGDFPDPCVLLMLIDLAREEGLEARADALTEQLAIEIDVPAKRAVQIAKGIDSVLRDANELRMRASYIATDVLEMKVCNRVLNAVRNDPQAQISEDERNNLAFMMLDAIEKWYQQRKLTHPRTFWDHPGEELTQEAEFWRDYALALDTHISLDNATPLNRDLLRAAARLISAGDEHSIEVLKALTKPYAAEGAAELPEAKRKRA